MSGPELSSPVSPTAIGPQPIAAESERPASTGIFKEAPVELVTSGEYTLSSDDDDYVEIVRQNTSRIDKNRIEKAIAAAIKGGLFQSLKTASRALIQLFNSVRQPASQDLKTLVNLETVSQLDKLNGKANASLNKFLSAEHTPGELIDKIKQDPEMLRDFTSFAKPLNRLAESSLAVERMIAAKNPGIAPEAQQKLASDFMEAARLLKQLYQARFDSQDPNTAFANFGEKKDNPFEQFVSRQGSTLGEHEQIRNWTSYALAYFEQCSQVMVDSINNQDPEIDMDMLRNEMESFVKRSDSDKLIFGKQHIFEETPQPLEGIAQPDAAAIVDGSGGDGRPLAGD